MFKFPLVRFEKNMQPLNSTPNNITFRKAISSDADKIAHIYLFSRKKLLSYAPLVHSDTEILRWIKEELLPTKQVIVVEKDKMIIGMMAITKNNDINWIDQLYLLPEWINCGIGSQLVTMAKTILGSPIQLHTFQENHSARGFYEKHGFQVVSLSDGSNNEEHCPDILYKWIKPEEVI